MRIAWRRIHEETRAAAVRHEQRRQAGGRRRGRREIVHRAQMETPAGTRKPRCNDTACFGANDHGRDLYGKPMEKAAPAIRVIALS
jgi:hypothetical protein